MLQKGAISDRFTLKVGVGDSRRTQCLSQTGLMLLIISRFVTRHA